MMSRNRRSVEDGIFGVQILVADNDARGTVCPRHVIEAATPAKPATSALGS